MRPWLAAAAVLLAALVVTVDQFGNGGLIGSTAEEALNGLARGGGGGGGQPASHSLKALGDTGEVSDSELERLANAQRARVSYFAKSGQTEGAAGDPATSPDGSVDVFDSLWSAPSGVGGPPSDTGDGGEALAITASDRKYDELVDAIGRVKGSVSEAGERLALSGDDVDFYSFDAEARGQLHELGYTNQGASDGGAPALGGDVRKQLESLGYLGQGASDGAAPSEVAAEAEADEVRMYVSPRDAASKVIGLRAGSAQGEAVAPPTNPGSKAENTSASPGLHTGLGAKQMVARGGKSRKPAAAQPVPEQSPADEALARARAGLSPQSGAVSHGPGSAASPGVPVAGAPVSTSPPDTAKHGGTVGVLQGGQGGGGGGSRVDSIDDDVLWDSEQAARLSSLGYIGAAVRFELDHDDSRQAYSRRRSGGESYADVTENPFVRITGDGHSALSTFGLDVDTASYSNVRRFLHRSQLPPPASVRLEELINAFTYDDPAPEGGDPLGVSVEAAGCPWTPGHRLVRIGIKGREIPASQRPPSNLVLLLDVSGSMKSADKLPLLVQSMELLLDSLRDDDRMAIVTYASGTELALPSTPVSERETIVSALRGLQANGSTHASAGIELAYQVATDAFLEEGNNRVLLATDGDFNVGVTEHGGLHDLITAKAKSGVFLTVLGFGGGNLKDDTAELLANKGNGNYAYIDGLDEAHRVLVREVQGTLHTIAKDVKIQVEFNPATVQAWRQLGYENRALAATDFRDDKKDAGEVGAGHSLTALYEVIPVGVELPGGTADLRYQTEAAPVTASPSTELLTVNLRWLPPEGGEASERAFPFEGQGSTVVEASDDLRFSAAVAAFGMALRGSQYLGDVDLLEVADLAEAARGSDPDGTRAEFVKLVRTARGLMGQ